MSRGKIHGIWVFGKTLLPLLFGRVLIVQGFLIVLLRSEVGLITEIFTMLPDSYIDPVTQSVIVFDWFKANHCFLKSLWQPLEVLVAYHTSEPVVPCKFTELLVFGRVIIQFSPLHSEFKELLLGPFLAHDVLEVLGEVIDHCPRSICLYLVPHLEYVCQVGLISSFSIDASLGLSVSKEQHGLLHGVIHGHGVFVNALVDAPAGHEFFDFVLISFKDLGSLSYQFV